MSVKRIERAGNRIPVPTALLDSFFQHISDRRFTEAEKCLQEIDEKIREKDYNDFKRGFIQALKGILIMLRSTDQSTFLSNLNLSNIENLKKYYSEFSSNANNGLHADYDRGYFSALAEYILFAIKRAESREETPPKD
jgi:ATP/maltotriose-dependent transcriptional regulator MalT